MYYIATISQEENVCLKALKALASVALKAPALRGLRLDPG
jgi:hypothetical protein